MNKTENKPQQEAKSQDKSQNQPKESFIGTGNGSSLRSRTGTWFECKVRYEKTQEDGSEKLVNEQYVVDALSFTEAEASILDTCPSMSQASLRLPTSTQPTTTRFSSLILMTMTFGSRLVWLSSPLMKRRIRRSVPISTTSSKPSASNVPSAMLMKSWARP